MQPAHELLSRELCRIHSSTTYHSPQKARGRFPNSAQSRQIASNHQPTRLATGGDSNRQTMYSMTMATQPPPLVRIGCYLYPACSVRVRYRYGYDGSYDDVSRLVAVATLVTASSTGQGTAVASGILRGRLVDSVHLTSEDGSENDDQVIGLASFPGVAIQQSGNYRIRITLVRMPVPGEQPVNLLAAYSNVVSVF
ncbi:hypothetical protein EV356DRAFT_280914 [Viridothelium virens]|uniref:Velvet domain-containing protein n=1 Tax=Viridothelium virens TaxID=1048519 RepID=A0A6A6H1Z0_VIRVR|nr:hypothetical protein EV356DRAFT_280914 [Viridothelium virens]